MARGTAVTPAIDPYRPLPGETEAQFAWYCYYRDLGLSRTIAAVANHFPDAAHPNTFVSCAKKRTWVERARAYDELKADTIRKAELRELGDRAVTLAKRRDDFQDNEYVVGATLLTRAMEVIRHPAVTTEELGSFTGPDGVRTKVIERSVGKYWSAHAAIEAARLGIEIIRLNLGQATQNVDLHIGNHAAASPTEEDDDDLNPAWNELERAAHAAAKADALAAAERVYQEQYAALFERYCQLGDAEHLDHAPDSGQDRLRALLLPASGDAGHEQAADHHQSAPDGPLAGDRDRGDP